MDFITLLIRIDYVCTCALKGFMVIGLIKLVWLSALTVHMVRTLQILVLMFVLKVPTLMILNIYVLGIVLLSGINTLMAQLIDV